MAKELKIYGIKVNAIAPTILKNKMGRKTDINTAKLLLKSSSKKTGIEIFGALDDLWLNKDTNEIVVLDYKATSNKKLEDYSMMYFNKVKTNYFIDEK